MKAWALRSAHRSVFWVGAIFGARMVWCFSTLTFGGGRGVGVDMLRREREENGEHTYIINYVNETHDVGLQQRRKIG